MGMMMFIHTEVVRMTVQMKINLGGALTVLL